MSWYMSEVWFMVGVGIAWILLINFQLIVINPKHGRFRPPVIYLSARSPEPLPDSPHNI